MSSTDRCHPPSSSAPPSFRLNQCKCASDPTSGRRCVLHPSASAAGNQERGDGVVTVEKREEREVMVEAMVVVEKVGRMVEKVEKVGRMVEVMVVVEKVGRMVEKVEKVERMVDAMVVVEKVGRMVDAMVVVEMWEVMAVEMLVEMTVGVKRE